MVYHEYEEEYWDEQMDYSYVVSLVAARESAMSSTDAGAVWSKDRPSGPGSGIGDMIAQMNFGQVQVKSHQISIISYH